VLIAKLSLYGITEPFLSWLRSYLIGRFQQVKVNGFLSDILPSGVPQEVHLSPLMFAIFIFDIRVCFKYCNHQLFSDNLQTYANVLTANDHNKIQDDLNRFVEWCRLEFINRNTDDFINEICLKTLFTWAHFRILFNHFKSFSNRSNRSV